MGLDPVKTLTTLRGLPGYFLDLWTITQQRKSSSKFFQLGKLYPCFEDKYSQSGVAEGHYFHQDLLVARRIYQNNPQIHVDVGSRIDGFVAHVAAFRRIEVIDIRPLSADIPNIRFIKADLMHDIDEKMAGYCDSLSCLHALEHFGLGRYGDSINYDGYSAGLTNFFKILKEGGKLYLSVPIGPQRIEFNAHRVFSLQYLKELFNEKYHIDHFSFVDDEGELHENVELDEHQIITNYGCNFGCGIFEMTKL
jgi:SAM-dependent methyltransferase